jgi:hypothetical protein
MGMFDSIIKRIEKYEEGVRFSKSATVDKSKSWNQLKQWTFSQMKVLMLEERLQKKTLSTLVILLQPQALLV